MKYWTTPERAGAAREPLRLRGGGEWKNIPEAGFGVDLL